MSDEIELVAPGDVPPAEGTWKVRSNCHFCGYLCGLTATVTDGRVTDLEPDPTRYPYDQSVLAGCPRWRTTIAFLESEDRVNYPLKRVGERGSGRWRRVGWDEALADISARLLALKERYGAETLATAIGGPHATYWPLHRFLSLFGSPNNMGIGQICWNPRIWMEAVTYGWPVAPAIDEVTGGLFLWGTNPAESDNSLFWRAIQGMARQGLPVVVVDPRETRTARVASLWLAPKPGTDPVVALGLIREVIAQGGVNQAFVDQWCSGFEELAQQAAPYTPQRVEELTGVPAEKLVAAAAVWSSGVPVALVSGRGIDQLGPNTYQIHRAINCLRAITGNVDRDGACHLMTKPTFIPEVELEMSDRLAPEQREKSLNRGVISLQTWEGWEAISELTAKVGGNRLPARYLTSVHPGRVWQAALTGDPYPVRALVTMGCNPLVTYGDTRLVHDAIASMDLVVALEYHLTPTAQLADYVLPMAGALERPLLQVDGGVADVAYGGERACDPYFERRSDYDFWRDLGLRCGQSPEDWPDEDLSAAQARTMAPTGLAWDEFCNAGLWATPPVYESYKEHGFATTTGKIELASEFLPRFGGDRVPTPKQLEPLAPGPDAGTVPLTLITGARFLPYYASSYFENPSFRKRHPVPWAEFSPATAARLGLSEGDEVEVGTAHGSVRFSVRITSMVDDVVSVEYGWWYPEKPAGEPGLSGAFERNANVLTGCDVPQGPDDPKADSLIGTWRYGAQPCTVRKAAPRPSER